MDNETKQISFAEIRTAFIEYLREFLAPPNMITGSIICNQDLQIASIQNAVANKVLREFRNPNNYGQQLRLDDVGKNEINRLIWSMITQGKMVPGSGDEYNLPWLTITPSGVEWLENDSLEPTLFFSSEEYLERLESQGVSLGKITLSYVDEAIKSYFSGCPKSSMVMIGVAMEALFDEIDYAVRNTRKDGWTNFRLEDQGRPYSRRLAQFEKSIDHKLQELVQITNIENPSIFLTPIFEHVRQMRNDGAHPKLPTYFRNHSSGKTTE